MNTRFALGSSLLLVALAACGKKDRPPAAAAPAGIATVVASEGLAETEHDGAWRPALPGAVLRAADAVKTAAGATARLRFRSGRHLDVGERSLVRLGLSADDTVVVSIELGEAFIEGDGQMSVHTSRGPARLAAGTRMRIRVEPNSTRYEILLGRAELVEGAETLVFGQGEGFRIALGRAEVERYRLTVGAAEIEENAPQMANPAQTPEAATPPKRTAAAGESAARPDRRAAPEPEPPSVQGPIDVVVAPGESPVIHAPHKPVLVRFRPPEGCVGRPALRLGRRHPPVSMELLTSLRPGHYPYQIRCGTGGHAKGLVRVVRDAGLRRVPRTAPTNTVDADGRRYTVLFQNLLPSLTFGWPEAARSMGPYVLHVATGPRVQRFERALPQFLLPSGRLSEGSHTFWITPARGPASPRTRLQIRFDNATVAAQIRTPADGVEVGSQDDIEIEGVAIEGSEVAVAGKPLDTDAQGRFRGRVPVPAPDRRAIAIRLEHPRGGVHYYVRRILRIE